MGHPYSFRIEGVTCERREGRLQAALGGLEAVELVRTPKNEAGVVLTITGEAPRDLSGQVVEASPAGAEHHYRVAPATR
jgi:hypothetical protein